MVYRFGRFSDPEKVTGGAHTTQDRAQRAFHNALRILMNVETDDLPFLNGEERRAFFSNPHLFFIRADDAACDRLWALIQERQPERYRT